MLAPHIHSTQILRRTRKLREQGLAPATESRVAAQARSVLASNSEQVIADIQEHRRVHQARYQDRLRLAA
ncbi:hypothetical protein [Kitasatospora sp. HPMI-4]|uniref:hypothetical protein n=1 Tax=Kitasatospora sp. HPMI-4 TaxID=3448443 RepID=UPI003F1934BF